MTNLADMLRDLLIDYERIRNEREGEDIEDVRELLVFEFLDNYKKKLIGE